jgi:hypothetical protein
MSPCISCVVSSEDEYGHDRTWQSEWIDTTCPECGQGFKLGDHVLVDEETKVAHHYDCFQGPKPSLEEGVVS